MTHINNNNMETDHQSVEELTAEILKGWNFFNCTPNLKVKFRSLFSNGQTV